MKGNPKTLLGPELKAGDKAPDFQATAQDLSAVRFYDSRGKVRLISAVPSLDTGVCDLQTKRFNEEAGKLPGVEIWTISMDLPFAQKRWCGANGVQNIKIVSDHNLASFGPAYGALIKDLRLLTRSIFVVDQHDVVRYVEYVPEVTTHPNYDAALAAVRAIAN
jgi:thiol peroxidase